MITSVSCDRRPHNGVWLCCLISNSEKVKVASVRAKCSFHFVFTLLSIVTDNTNQTTPYFADILRRECKKESLGEKVCEWVVKNN